MKFIWKENIINECNIDLLNKFKYIYNKSTNKTEKENYIKDILNNIIITDMNIIKYYFWETYRLSMDYLKGHIGIEKDKFTLMPNDYVKIVYKCGNCNIEELEYYPATRHDILQNITKNNKIYKNVIDNYRKNIITTFYNFENLINYTNHDNIKNINEFKPICKKCKFDIIKNIIEEENLKKEKEKEEIEDEKKFIEYQKTINPLFNLDEYIKLNTMCYDEYLQTEHWQNVRERALIRANHKCQICSSKDKLRVHHNTYNSRGNERDEDLIAVCDRCHRKIHNYI